MFWIFLSFVFRGLARGVRAVAEPLYIHTITTTHGVSAILGVSRFFGIFAPWIVSFFLSRLSPVVIALLTGGGIAISFMFLSFIASPGPYLLLRVFLILLTFPFATVLATLAQKAFVKKQNYFFLLFLLQELSIGLGAFTAGHLSGYVQPGVLLFLTGILFLLSVLSIYRVLISLLPRRAFSLRPRLQGSSFMALAPIWPFVFLSSFFWGFRDVIFPIALGGRAAGIAIFAARLFFIITSSIGFLLFGMKLPETLKRLTALAYALSFLGIALLPASSTGFILFSGLFGLAEALRKPFLSAYISEFSDSKKLEINAALVAMRTLATALGSLLASVLYELFGFKFLVVLAITFMFLAL